ncbi:MAG TPA: hypothetical protein VIH10_10540 [Kribbella sp.]|jgi:hypothetical protein
MTENEDPIVGAGAANKPQVWDEGDNDSPLPEPKKDEQGRPESGERPASDDE